MTALGLLEGCEQNAVGRPQILLDRTGYHRPHRGFLLDALDLRVERRQDDDGLGLAFVERSLELVFGVQRVERCDDRARLPGAELRDDCLRRVGQQESHSVATIHALPLERSSEGVRCAIEVAVGDPGALEDQCRVGWPLGGRFADNVDERLVGIGSEGGRDTLVVLAEPRLGAWCICCSRGDRHPTAPVQGCLLISPMGAHVKTSSFSRRATRLGAT